MIIASAIRQTGFRKWYERELLRSHSHLLLVLFSVLGALGGLEALFDSHGVDRLLMALCVLLAGGVSVWALRSYLFHLTRAEVLAKQAGCPQCEVYGRWQVEGDAQTDAQAAEGGARLRVCCRGCGHRWPIDC